MADNMIRANQQLRPKETVQKMLISTTSRMTGEYEHHQLVITHAWPQFRSHSIGMRLAETHMSRSGYIVAFETPPIEKRPGTPVPDYSPTGEVVAAYLAVFFGKRFDCHGVLEGSGLYQIPDLGSYDTPCNPKLPFNSHHVRNCFTVPLELNKLSMIERVFVGATEVTNLSRLNAACKFYMQALQNAENNTEVAYLHLITAGELLSGEFRYPGTKGVKKKFVTALCSLTDDAFYTDPGEEVVHGRFARDDMEESIGAAYDLRSRYVHTGAPFGMWVDPARAIAGSDLQVGRPVVEDRRFASVLAAAPTFTGLERLVRYCILRFMTSRGLLMRDSKL